MCYCTQVSGIHLIHCIHTPNWIDLPLSLHFKPRPPYPQGLTWAWHQSFTTLHLLVSRMGEIYVNHVYWNHCRKQLGDKFFKWWTLHRSDDRNCLFQTNLLHLRSQRGFNEVIKSPRFSQRFGQLQGDHQKPAWLNSWMVCVCQKSNHVLLVVNITLWQRITTYTCISSRYVIVLPKSW